MKAILVIIIFIVTLLQFIFSCNNDVEIKTYQYISHGDKIYKTRCQGCHGVKGEGLGTLYPPLTDTAFLKNNYRILPKIIKNGMKGKINVNGQIFNSTMPSHEDMTAVDISYVLTFIHFKFLNINRRWEFKEVEDLLTSSINKTE
jgi:mono/diheme cytochrome c family protein